jgi:hypothetical protein
MLLLLISVFVSSFVFVAVLGTAVAWGFHVRAEWKAWRNWRRHAGEEKNTATWQSGQPMIAS